MLGDVEETVYIVEEDDEEEETLKVSPRRYITSTRLLIHCEGNQETIGDAIRQRLVVTLR